LPKVVVVLPTYNEAENLARMVAELFSLRLDPPGQPQGLPISLEILVIDDNSPDGTGAIADRLAVEHPGSLFVIHRPGKMGLGTAYLQGFKYALDRGADYVVQMDTDFSHSPSHLPIFMDKIRDYDVVVGSRYVAGGSLDETWSPWRRFLSWWGNCVWVRLILGLKVHDATGGFKCFRRQVLESILAQEVRCNGYAFQVEMAYICQTKGFRVLEVPIYFADRARGKSKMSLSVQLEAAWRVCEMRLRSPGGPIATRSR